MGKSFVIAVTEVLEARSDGRRYVGGDCREPQIARGRCSASTPSRCSYLLWSKHLHPEVSTVQVSLFNDAQVSPTLISEGEKVATRVIAWAGVNLEWLLAGSDP